MSDKASKAELREELAERRGVGRRMANILFNVTQRPTKILDDTDVKIMTTEWHAWDAIKRAEPK